MKGKFLLALAAQLFIIDTFASGYLTPFTNTGVKISHFFTHSNGGVTLLLSGTITNPDGCQVTSRVHLKGDLEGHKTMTSAALAAFASGKNIGLWSSGCENIPFWGGGIQTPIIANLWIVN